MTKKQDTTREDIAVLQEQVREIKDNHLVHLALDIKNLDTKIDSHKESLDAKIDTYKDTFTAKIDRGTWLAITVLVGVIVTLGTLWLK